jgi:hypothetical protein
VSVHDKEYYPAIKKLLGIPEDEPIYILRAQDKFSAGVITAHRSTAESAAKPEWASRVQREIDDFRFFQQKNPERVKVPD